MRSVTDDHVDDGGFGRTHVRSEARSLAAPVARAGGARFFVWVRRTAALICLSVAAALTGSALAERARASRPLPRLEVRVGGVPVDREPSEAADAIAEAWEAQLFEVHVEGAVVSGTRSELGGRVDRVALRQAIAQAWDPNSPMSRFHRSRDDAAPLDLPLPVRLDPRPLLAQLAAHKDRIDRRAQDARIEARTGRILAETTGLRLDVLGTLDDVHEALMRGAPSTVARIIPEEPARRASDLARVRVEALLGFFETRYSTLEDARDRTFNLRVAASKVDGTVLMPGETFDFNAVVGERNEANGFRPAPEIAGGELVDGVGGGTCQVAGTLHAAAFFAGLPIVERSPHSRPSGYIWMGLDSVVVYPQLDLRFTNDLPFPIVLGMTVEGGVVRAEIRGARADRTVTFTRRIDEVRPFTEREVSDPSLPSGVRVLRQRGVPGFTITRFRIVRELARNQARRERWQDTYPPTDQIVRVGTGPAAPPGYTPPPGDAHGEYTADEFLTASQGVGIEGLDVSRRAGRTGEPGWTSRAGMPGTP